MEFHDNNNDALIHIEEVIDPKRYGVVELDNIQPDKIISLEEKPDNPKSNLVITGFYVMSKKIFDAIKKIKISYRNELELTDALNILCKEGDVRGKLINGWRKDIGYKEDLLGASKWMLENLDEVNLKIMSYIDESNKLIPPLFIGKNCTITNSKIGPNVSIGNNVLIKNSKVKNSILLDNTKIIDINMEYDVLKS